MLAILFLALYPDGMIKDSGLGSSIIPARKPSVKKQTAEDQMRNCILYRSLHHFLLRIASDEPLIHDARSCCSKTNTA